MAIDSADTHLSIACCRSVTYRMTRPCMETNKQEPARSLTPVNVNPIHSDHSARDAITRVFLDYSHDFLDSV